MGKSLQFLKNFSFNFKGSTIFTRLIFGYLIIFILVIALTIYAIFQLNQFENVTREIHYIDHQMLEIEKKLSDSMLAQMGFERKYSIVKDKALHDQYLLASEDFKKNLDQALFFSSTASQKNILQAIKKEYEGYNSVVTKEIELIKSNKPYNQRLFKEEKDKAIDQILEDLKNLAAISRQITSEKIKKLSEIGREARELTIFIAIAALAGALLISFFITRTITKPISRLIDKTREIAKGIFKEDLQISSPPEIKELSQAINSMCAQLKALDQMKSDFFSMISHELRTPLTSIKVGSELLLQESGRQISESQKEILGILSRESQRLIDLVNSILDLAKMEAGVMVFQFKPTNIGPLIQQVVEEFKPLALGTGINLRLEDLTNLPLVKLDAEKIKQVVRNFIGNAIKFTPKGGQVTISAFEKGGSLQVCVKDTGPGIPKESLPKIFEKFQQASLQKTSLMKGTGLGLAIAKQIILAHGGKIWAESEAGQGSSFFFALPA